MSEPTPETLAYLLKAQPMRRLVTRECRACGHRWVQPAATGGCPRCHATDVVNLEQRVSALPVA